MKYVPMFVITHNRVRTLRKLVDWLERAGHERIVFVDNASTYQPLLDYLAETPHRTVRLRQNWGAHVLWDRAPLVDSVFEDFASREDLNNVVCREPYVVTDPDCVPTEECPLDLVEHLSEALDRHPTYRKAGPGFYLDDLPTNCPRLGHERALQTQEESPGYYSSAIDTTFALYSPGLPFMRRAIRTAFPYQIRHLCPSYYTDMVPDEEDRYYTEHARRDTSGSTWASKTVLV